MVQNLSFPKGNSERPSLNLLKQQILQRLMAQYCILYLLVRQQPFIAKVQNPMQGTKCPSQRALNKGALRPQFCTMAFRIYIGFLCWAIWQADKPTYFIRLNNEHPLSGSKLLIFTLNLNLLQETKIYNELSEFVCCIWICYRNTAVQGTQTLYTAVPGTNWILYPALQCSYNISRCSVQIRYGTILIQTRNVQRVFSLEKNVLFQLM